MFFITPRGYKRKLTNPYKYIIDWDSKSRSKFQREIKKLLKTVWHYNVVFEEFPVLGTRLRIDFYNATERIAIEVDGDQHYKYNKHFHSKSKLNFLKQLSRDEIKEKFCNDNDIKLVRICKSDNITTIESLIDFIKNYE